MDKLEECLLNLETRRAARNYSNYTNRENSYRRQGLNADADRCKAYADQEYVKLISLTLRGGKT